MKKDQNALWPGLILSASLMAILAAGCHNDDNKNDNMYTLSGTANGAQETPANASPATGTLSGTYDADANYLTYTITWNNLTDSVSAMHFHGPALPGTPANVLIGITPATRAKSGSTSGTVTLADSVEAFLLAGKLYYNIHNKTYPNGEIRGQVSATR